MLTCIYFGIQVITRITMKAPTTIVYTFVLLVFTSVSTDAINVLELEVTSRVTIRYARVLVRSLMENEAPRDQEARFHVRLPKEAYITSFILITNNKTITAVIKEKGKAQEMYDKAKSDNVTAGHVTQQGVSDDLDSDVFQIEVNVAATDTVEFRLEYEELVQRHAGKYSQKIYVDSKHVVPKLEVKCEFKEKQKFKVMTYQTPFHKARAIYDEGTMIIDGYYVNKLEWKPSMLEQETASNVPEIPFEIEYELVLQDGGGMVFINDNGEFVHMFSVPCEDDKVMRKQVVFVIDISGSMSGNPILQVRKAMLSILSQLRPNDYFNIVTFDHKSEMWRSTFQIADYRNINNATAFVRERVVAAGATNINDALLLAVDLFDNSLSSDFGERFGHIIVFLTDGSPTAGVTDTATIRGNVRARNYFYGEKCCKSSIFTIAFGRNAAIDFLREIAHENEGTLTIIKETESTSADGELIEVYNDIENPYYKNLVFSFKSENENIPQMNVTQTEFLQFDCGNEIVIGGWSHPDANIYPTVTADGIRNDVVFNSVPTVLILNDESEMLSRLVFYKKVKQLLQMAETTIFPKKRETLNKMALALSLDYGFVTPLTSLVVAYYSPKQRSGSDMYMDEYDMYMNEYERASIKRANSGSDMHMNEYGRASIKRANSVANSRSSCQKLVCNQLCLLFTVVICLIVKLNGNV